MVKWKEVKKGTKLKLLKRPITHPENGYSPLEIGDIVTVTRKNKKNYWDLENDKYSKVFGLSNDKNWLVVWEIVNPKCLMDLKI
jgi:hypothetical protein